MSWRSVVIGLREVLLPGLSWVLGDGRRIRFWKDKWLLNRPLCELVTSDLPAGYEEVKVRDLWGSGSGWDFANIVPYVSLNNKLQLSAIVVDTVTGARDTLSWGWCPDGKFTVRTAYSFLTFDDMI